jgi:hypothetical protein
VEYLNPRQKKKEEVGLKDKKIPLIGDFLLE